MSAANWVNPRKLSVANGLFEDLYLMLEQNMGPDLIFPCNIRCLNNNLLRFTTIKSFDEVDEEDRGKTFFYSDNWEKAVFYPFQDGVMVEVEAFLSIIAKWTTLVSYVRELADETDDQELLVRLQQWEDEKNSVIIF